MHVHHRPTHDATPSAIATARLDRRSLLRRTVVGLAAPGALALAGLPTGRTGAQSAATTPATPSPPAERGYAPVNGLALYYEVHGAAPGGHPPLVLLHGGLATIDAEFGRVLPALARARRVVAVELQAHGRTADVDRPLRFESMADDVAALVAHLGLASADVLGFSLGGGVALQTAIRHPSVARKLVVASAPCRRDGWYPAVLAGMAAMEADAMVGTPLHGAYVATAPQPDDWPVLVAKLRQLLGEDYDWAADVAAMAAPTLVVVGDADGVRPEHAVELLRLRGGGVPGDLAGLPSSRLAVLPGTTHAGVLARADLLLPVVVPFLDAPTPQDP